MRLAVLFTLLPAILATPISQLAPLSANGNVIEDQYIVVFKKGVNPANIALHLDSIAESSLTHVSVCPTTSRRHHPRFGYLRSHTSMPRSDSRLLYMQRGASRWCPHC